MKFLKIILFILLLISKGPFNIMAQNIDSLIIKEFEKIKLSTGEINAFLEIIDTLNISSRSAIGGRVIINKKQILSINNKINAKHKDYVLKMFISHEIAHQILYRYYGLSQPVLLNECQADIITGHLVFEQIGKEFLSDIDKLKLGKEGFIEVMSKSKDPMNAIFNLGDQSFKEHSHPRNEQRRTAFRDGFYLGELMLMNELVKITDIPSENKAQIREGIYNLEQLLNFTHGQSIMTWSLDRAKGIIHDDISVCRDIISIVDFKWNESSKYPFLEYSIQLKNIGKKNINFKFESQIKSVLRADPKNSLYWDIVNAKTYDFYLKPGTQKKIVDKLEWSANDTLMPSIVQLSDNNSFYSCSCQDLNHNSRLDVFQNHESKIASESNPNFNALVLLINDTDNLQSYINSLGFITRSSFKKISNIYYNCIYQFPNSDYTRILYNLSSNKYSLESSWTTNLGEKSALVMVENLVHEFLGEMPDISIEKTRNKGDISIRLIKKDAKIANIYMFNFDRRHIITMELFSQ